MKKYFCVLVIFVLAGSMLFANPEDNIAPVSMEIISTLTEPIVHNMSVEEKLVGTWINNIGNIMLVFGKDGTVLGDSVFLNRGTHWRIEDNRIVIYLSRPGYNMDMWWRFSISEDSQTLTLLGHRLTFRRIN